MLTVTASRIALAASLLLVGVGFALPFALHLPNHPWLVPYAPEALNLYCLVGWMGWAHFLFAHVGQGGVMAAKGRAVWFPIVVLCALGLLAIRGGIGENWFGRITWLYFLAHYVKAELHFHPHLRGLMRQAYFAPLAAFAWLSVVLLDDLGTKSPWGLLLGTLLLAGLFWLAGVGKLLETELSRLVLLSAFLLGEALVWGTYGKYMTLQFRNGVYLFHVAGASFYHYATTYSYAQSRAAWLTNSRVLAGNGAMIAVGYAVTVATPVAWLRPILDVQFFPVWVTLHLVTSDLFPRFRRMLAS